MPWTWDRQTDGQIAASLISAQFHARLYNLACFSSFFVCGERSVFIRSRVVNVSKRFARWSHCPAFNDRRFPLLLVLASRVVRRKNNRVIGLLVSYKARTTSVQVCEILTYGYTGLCVIWCPLWAA